MQKSVSTLQLISISEGRRNFLDELRFDLILSTITIKIDPQSQEAGRNQVLSWGWDLEKDKKTIRLSLVFAKDLKLRGCLHVSVCIQQWETLIALKDVYHMRYIACHFCNLF